MRRISTFLLAAAASMVMLAAPVKAAEETMGFSESKDECLLVAKNCANTVDSIVSKVDRLNREIAKGTSVYTQEELAILKGKLNDANAMLNSLLTGGA